MTLLSTGTDYDALAAAFRPIFTRIAQGAAEREQQRILPDEPIRWLKEAGFGTLRIPREKGGWGASLPQLSALLIELAQADSNLPQALRAHFAFVEDQLNQPDSAGRDRWFRRFLDGELVGSGWTEIGAVKLGEVNTRGDAGRGRLATRRREVLQHRRTVRRLDRCVCPAQRYRWRCDCPGQHPTARRGAGR